MASPSPSLASSFHPFNIPTNPSFPPLKPTHDAVVLIAVVERVCPTHPSSTCTCRFTTDRPPALRFSYNSTPNSTTEACLTLAKNTLSTASSFIFPPDIPVHPPAESSIRYSQRPTTAPPQSCHPTPLSPCPLPSSPLTDSPPCSPPVHPIDAARTLPQDSRGLYAALVEVSPSPSDTARHPRHHTSCITPSLPPPHTPHSGPRGDSTTSSDANLRRARSVPRRPSSSPPPRLRSENISATPHASLPQHTQHPHLASSNRYRRAFRNVLLSARTHVFAITAKDGARQYAYCRPLSSSHSLVLLSSLAHTSVYVSALERTAAQYAYMADDVSCFPKRRRHLDPESLGPCSSGHPSHSLFNSSLFLNSDVMRCLPRVARHLCKSLLEWLNNPFPDSSRDFVAGSLKRRAEHAPEHYDLDKENGDPTTDPEGSSAPCLTSSTTSSGLLANVVKDCSTEKDYRSLWRKEREMNSRMTNGGGRSAFSLPWEIELNSEDTSPVSVARIIELGDATLLFRHFSIRSLLSIVVAVLEERRLCIVGPSTALVSRAVLAVDNLLRPFEWPHLMSPILLEHMLPVLGAPFPFMVGILEDHFPQTKDLPLDDVVFADLHTGKVTSTSDLGDFSRRIPRRIRYRFEKRLTRAKAACMRQIYRSRSTPFVPVVSNTATSFFEGDPFDDGPQDKRPGLLWRSKSQQKIAYEPLQQNIWLARETVTMLDKGMRKFFSGLLENFTAFRLEDAAMADGYNRLDSLPRSAPLPSSSMSFGSRRETDRRQLARAFCATQMFMQWEDSEGCDVTFGLIPVESMLKRRGSLCEQSLTSRRTNVEDLEYPTRMSYARQPGTSDGECARYDASVFSGDSSLRRKRFGGKRKNRHSSVKRHFNSDAEDLPMESRSIFSDAESNYRPVRPTTEPNITPALDRTLSTVCEPDWDVGTAPKRLWLSLRLPSSNWSLGRDLGMFTYKDDGEDLAEEEGQSGATEMLDGSSDGNETEDLVESNHRNDRGEVFPVEEVGATWNLVCAWNRRRGKQSRI